MFLDCDLLRYNTVPSGRWILAP